LHTYRDEAGRSLTVSFIDDQHAISGGSSNNVRFWSLYDEREQQHFDLDDEPIYSMIIIEDEQMAAVGTQNAVVLVELSAGTELRRFTYNGGAVTSVATSLDGKTLIAGFEDTSTIMWDMESGEAIRRLEGHSTISINSENQETRFGSILDLAVSPDGQRVLSGAEDRTMLVWDVNTGDIVYQYESCSDTINTGAFSPDGRYFVGGFGTISAPTRGNCPDTDYTIHLWDAATGDLIRQFVGHQDAVVKVRFSPNGRWLVSGSIDESIRLWDVETSREIRQFDGHTGGVMSVEFSDDGQYIVSGAADGTVKVWDADTGDLLRQFVIQGGHINTVQFSADSSAIWTSSADNSLRLWLPMLDQQELLTWVSENRYVRELTCSEQELYLLAEDCE
jgi:WD40 repeat protein